MLVLPLMWHRVAHVACTLALLAFPLSAQTWNDARSTELVTRATTRRAQQLADSSLADYQSSAHGYLTFLAQLGEGFLLPPKVVKADEIALEVYWRAPDFSKQWIVGRRDTLVLPTDIQYHRDHLGIIQNNFPDIIRLGDGDEVRDVPHPLSASGAATYDFAIGDSLRLQLPGRLIDVIEVKIRPKDDQAAAAVGSLYISREDAQVVRMAFSFTRTALKDPQLDDVSIILENSLIAERYWLPRRQEIEIRRSGSWMDFPVKGIIRGRWEIRDYRVNAGGTQALTPGPEIVYAPAQRRLTHKWPATSILDSLPSDVTLATNDDVRAVQEEARRLVRGQALARSRNTLPSVRGFSDVVQMNRVEGMAVGAGLRRRLGRGLDIQLQGRWGTADREAKGALSLGLERASGLTLRLKGYRDFRDAGDVMETSRARNSIAAQEFGSDYTQPFGVQGIAFSLQRPLGASARWSAELNAEEQSPLKVHAAPARGRFLPTLAATPGRSGRVALRAERPLLPVGRGFALQWRLEGRLTRFSPDSATTPWTTTGRLYATSEVVRGAGRGSLRATLSGGVLGANREAPVQELLLAGGPISAPGYGFHQFSGTRLLSGRAEWRHPIPFVPVPLGRWGRLPAAATLAPFVGAVAIGGRPGEGLYPYAGVGAITFLDLVRFDVAKGLKDGRWRFAVDVSRDFWPIL